MGTLIAIRFSRTVIMFSLVCRTARSFSLHSRKPTLKLRQPGFSQYYRTKQFPGYRSFHHSLSTSSDDSAVSKSRAPFSMPKQSPNDSMLINTHKSQRKGPADLAWNQLGLWTELADCLQDEMGFHAPTLIQNMAIPNLLLSTDHSDEKNYPSLCFLAATGSGKTLAYTLPLLQLLKQGEVFTDSSDSLPLYERPRKRPRLIVLAPTRELVLQITATVKQLCHVLKLSAVPLYKGKQNYGAQAKALDRPVDIVVATPGRLLQHWQDKNVYLSALQHVVVDEMDTMLEQGFSKELKALLYPVLYHKQADQKFETPELQPKAPRLVLTSATMTRAILKMMGQQDTGAGVTARKNHVKHSDNGGNDNKQMILPPMKVLKADGLHRVVPNLQQVFVDTGNTDKMSLVIDILSSSSSNPSKNNMLTMVFCNTAASCRAVEYALGEAGIKSLPYHGELNSSLRTSNLAAFRQAGQNVSSKQDDSEDDARVLVCTDLAARGLDVPQVDHVVMFDFPLNSLDYLHRSGRTARGYDLQRKGKVTALVSKRDRVLANAIEQAVLKGEPLDGLSSRKSDYLPGGRLHVTGNTKKKGASFKRNGSGASSGDNSDKRGRHRDSFGKRRGSSRQHSRSSR